MKKPDHTTRVLYVSQPWCPVDTQRSLTVGYSGVNYDNTEKWWRSARHGDLMVVARLPLLVPMKQGGSLNTLLRVIEAVRSRGGVLVEAESGARSDGGPKWDDAINAATNVLRGGRHLTHLTAKRRGAKGRAATIDTTFKAHWERAPVKLRDEVMALWRSLSFDSDEKAWLAICDRVSEANRRELITRSSWTMRHTLGPRRKKPKS